MSSDLITMSVNGMELWNTLNLKEGLCYSPKFQLALRTSESEVEILQERYKDAIDLFQRAQRAGEKFSETLAGVCRCLNNAITPSPNLPVAVDRETEMQSVIGSINTFSNLISEFSSRLQRPMSIFEFAATQLDELHHKRKEFYREEDQVAAAINKAAGVQRNKLSDAEDADSSLLNAKKAFAFIAKDYLTDLRLALGPTRLSTVLNATLSTFEIQQLYSRELVKIRQPEDCLLALKTAVNAYHVEINSQKKIGLAVLPADQASIRHEGYLFKRSKKKRWRTWVRRWFMAMDNRLVYFSSLSDSGNNITWKILEPDLRLCTAKPLTTPFGSGDPLVMSSSMSNSTERRFAFELISPSGKVHHLQAQSAEDMEKWVSVLRSGLLDSSARNSRRTPDMSSSSCAQRRLSTAILDGMALLDETPITGNKFCADCLTDKDVTWASTNLGITICTDCASFHRSVGVHISKVRSLVLDNWEPELLEVMRNLGNKLVSMVFESHLQSQPLAAQRPQPGDPKAAQFRRNWIEAKWVRRAFVRPIIGAPTTATDTNNTSNVWLMDIYRVWLMQMHSGGNMGSLVPPAFLSSASSTRYSVASSASMHANNKLNAAPLFVDRRRKHSAVPGPTARAQVTLDTLCAHLDSLMTSASVAIVSQHSSSSSSYTTVHQSEPSLLSLSASSSSSPSRDDVAARLVLVAGARLGCAPLILMGLACGATPNALPRAADWPARVCKRLRLSAEGDDPLGAVVPPLISAVTGGRIAACELLLTNGADINSVDQDGRTALHHACSLQRVHLVCLLLRRHANQDIRDKTGRRPIDVAMDTAHADIVTLLRLQNLHSGLQVLGKPSSPGGQDNTATEVFRDFTSRAYHLEWDSEEEDYHEPNR